MIPMELISMLGSTVLGGVMSIMAQKGQAEQAPLFLVLL
jgi:hypothetical protein